MFDDDKRNKLDLPRGTGVFAGGFILVWVLGIIGTLGFWAVVIWAIVKLVNHFAG